MICDNVFFCMCVFKCGNELPSLSKAAKGILVAAMKKSEHPPELTDSVRAPTVCLISA